MSREKLNHLWTTRRFDVIRIKKMRIKVKVITNAKENRVLEEKGGYKVYLNATPVHGKANKALIETLARYFHTKKGNIRIIKGERSKEKHLEIIT